MCGLHNCLRQSRVKLVTGWWGRSARRTGQDNVFDDDVRLLGPVTVTEVSRRRHERYLATEPRYTRALRA